MSQHTFGARHSQPSLGALSALDAGLRVRIEIRSPQQTLFSGAENLSAQQLTSELAEMVSELRVRSFAVRAQLEQITSALLVNVRCGFWPLASRAALDLASVLSLARKRHLADAELLWRGENGALRVAELCGKEAR